jgi:hypothetical protein
MSCKQYSDGFWLSFLVNFSTEKCWLMSVHSVCLNQSLVLNLELNAEFYIL